MLDAINIISTLPDPLSYVILSSFSLVNLPQIQYRHYPSQMIVSINKFILFGFPSSHVQISLHFLQGSINKEYRQLEGLGDPSLYLQGSWHPSTHILIRPCFYKDSISKSIILEEVDQDEGVGFFSTDIKIRPTPFLDIILNE